MRPFISIACIAMLLAQLLHDRQQLGLAALADVLDRPAAMWREPGAEHDPRIAEIRILDDLLAHARHRLVQGGRHHAIGERLQVDGAGAGAGLHRLALHPGVKALAGLLAEVLRFDQGLQLLRDRRAG